MPIVRSNLLTGNRSGFYFGEAADTVTGASFIDGVTEAEAPSVGITIDNIATLQPNGGLLINEPYKTTKDYGGGSISFTYDMTSEVHQDMKASVHSTAQYVLYLRLYNYPNESVAYSYIRIPIISGEWSESSPIDGPVTATYSWTDDTKRAPKPLGVPNLTQAQSSTEDIDFGKLHSPATGLTFAFASAGGDLPTGVTFPAKTSEPGVYTLTTSGSAAAGNHVIKVTATDSASRTSECGFVLNITS